MAFDPRVKYGNHSQFEVFAKYGNNWANRGEVEAKDSNQAAKEAAYLLNRLTIGVRPANSDIQPVTVKFSKVPQF